MSKIPILIHAWFHHEPSSPCTAATAEMPEDSSIAQRATRVGDGWKAIPTQTASAVLTMGAYDPRAFAAGRFSTCVSGYHVGTASSWHRERPDGKAKRHALPVDAAPAPVAEDVLLPLRLPRKPRPAPVEPMLLTLRPPRTTSIFDSPPLRVTPSNPKLTGPAWNSSTCKTMETDR